MKTIITFLATLAVMLLLGEIGQRFTSFLREGNFITVFIFSSLLSSLITLIVSKMSEKKELKKLEGKITKLRTEGETAVTRLKYQTEELRYKRPTT